VTGYAGLSGSRTLYLNDETRKKLLDRYPKSFFAVLGEKYESPEAVPAGVRDREDAADGGVFGAMWRLLKRNRLGADFSQREIPLLQQTVEICETFGLDPYRMESAGCAVWLCEDASGLSDAAKAASVPCVRIGFTAKGPGIRRTDGQAVAFLRKS